MKHHHAQGGDADQTLSPEEIDRLSDALSRMGLVDLGESVQWKTLTGGVSSLIAVASRKQGPICVKAALPRLKVAANWLAPIERNEAEIGWIREATAIVPEAVPRVIGHDPIGQAFAMEYLPPEQFSSWKVQLLHGKVDTTTASQVAHTLAAIHGATAHDPRLATAFANADNFFALRLDPYFGEAARRHPDCAPILRRLIDDTHARRIALVHGDVSPKNLMVGPRGPIFLDAECATFGDPAFDLSFCLSHLLLKQVILPDLRAALAACFEAMVLEYLAKVSWESRFDFENRAAVLLPALLLARVDGKSPVEYLGGPDQVFVRDFARKHLLLSPAVELLGVGLAWQEALRA